MLLKVIIILCILALFLFIFQKTHGEPIVGQSPIQGEGVFANRAYKKGEKVIFCVDEKNNIIGKCKKVNHCPKTSWKHNTKLVQDGKVWHLIATRDIQIGEELSADYRDTPHFIKKPGKDWVC